MLGSRCSNKFGNGRIKVLAVVWVKQSGGCCSQWFTVLARCNSHPTTQISLDMFRVYSVQRQTLRSFPCLPQRRASSSGTLTLGIRREDPSRLWERRVPLTPDAVEHLIKTHGVRVLIQPCARRAYPTKEFLKVGVTCLHILTERFCLMISLSGRSGTSLDP